MDYNNQRLQEILMPLHVLQAVDQYPRMYQGMKLKECFQKDVITQVVQIWR